MSGFVEHGRAIWQLGLGLLVTLGALAALWGPGVGRRARALVARRRLGRARGPEGLADGMVVTLAGELRAKGPHASLTGEAARTVVMGRAITHLRTDEVLLAVGPETSIELAGPLEVVLGSSESTARVSEEDGRARVCTRVVRPGDRVRARGALEACAGDATGVGYRTASHRFRLVPEDGRRPVQLVADGQAGRPGPRVGALLRGAALGAAAFLVLFVAGGAAARHAARSAGLEDPALRPGWGLSAASFAAATPFHRGAVFDVVEAALRDTPPDGLASATVALAAKSASDCTAATLALVRAGELERASRRGAACPEAAARLEAAHAHLALAEWDAAAPIYRKLAPSLDDADRARALVAQVMSSRPSPWTVHDEDRCLLVSAAAATGGLGADFAREQLRRALRDAGPTRRTCALLLAQHLAGRDRDEVLSGTVAPDDPFGPLLGPAADDGAARARVSGALDADTSTLLGTAGPRRGLVPGLARSLLERDRQQGEPPASRLRRAGLAADVATFASLAGDSRGARAAFAIVWRAVAAEPGLAERAQLLGAAIDLRAGDLAGAAGRLPPRGPGAALADRLRRAVAARRGDLEVMADGVAAEARPAFVRALRRGDGRGLARALAIEPLSVDASVLPSVAARVRSGRRSLQAWARWYGAADARRLAVDPLALLASSASQLELARALQDGPRVRELEGTIARLHAALWPAELALTAALVPPSVR